MNKQKYVIAGFAATFWLFIYGWVANGVLLHDFWSESSTAAFMRAEEDIVMWAVALAFALQGFAIAALYAVQKGRSLAAGIKVALMAVGILAGFYLVTYALQPVELGDILIAVVVDGLGFAGAGAVIAMLYKTD